MVTRLISIDSGAMSVARARDALSTLSGVVAAEIASGGRAVRVWQSGELTADALSGALESSGVRGARIGAPTSLM